MTDSILHVRWKLGHRYAKVGDDKNRIVAEPTIAAKSLSDAPVTDPMKNGQLSSWTGHSHHTLKTRPPLRGRYPIQ